MTGFQSCAIQISLSLSLSPLSPLSPLSTLSLSLTRPLSSEPQKLQDAIIAAIRLASSAFASGAFATPAACLTEPAPAPSTPTSHELTGKHVKLLL